VLADDLVRVLFLRNGTLKEPRTWTVAPADTPMPWEGRDRLDVSGFERPEFAVAEAKSEITLTTAKLSLAVSLRPFGLRWSAGGKVFAADRPTYSYQWSERSGTVRHYMARTRGDRYFGLGDKTGPLDKQGRRFRTIALDALGYDAVNTTTITVSIVTPRSTMATSTTIFSSARESETSCANSPS
jgi:alpha-glucosidase